MKTSLKWFAKFLMVCASMVFAFLASALFLIFFSMFMSWLSRQEDVAKEMSPDGKYHIAFRETASPDWPFGSAHVRVTIYEGSRVIERFDEDVASDGVHFSDSHYSVSWEEDEVAITFVGEQAPHQRIIPLKD